jgi:hypothetical protein
MSSRQYEQESQAAAARGDLNEAERLRSLSEYFLHMEVWFSVKCYLTRLEDTAMQLTADYHSSRQTVFKESFSREREFRQGISQSFHLLQIQQIGQLVEHEKTFLMRAAQERLRPVPGAQALKERALQAAKSKRFDQAVKLQDECNAVVEPELKRRQEKVERRFYDGRWALLEQHKGEMRQLTIRLESGLEGLHDKQESELGKVFRDYKQKLGTACQSVIKEIREKVPEKKTREDAARACGLWFADILRDVAQGPQEEIEASPVRVDMVLRSVCPEHAARTPRQLPSPKAPKSHRSATPKPTRNLMWK